MTSGRPAGFPQYRPAGSTSLWIPVPQTQDPKPKIPSHGSPARDPKPKIASRRSQPQDPKPERPNQRSQAKDPKPKIPSQRPQAQDPKPEVPSQRSKAKDPKPKIPKNLSWGRAGVILVVQPPIHSLFIFNVSHITNKIIGKASNDHGKIIGRNLRHSFVFCFAVFIVIYGDKMLTSSVILFWPILVL